MMHLSIPRRYNGPPEMGNGGYAAGAISVALGRDVRVRLKQPLPLDTALLLAPAEEGWHLRHGDAVLATAVPATIELAVPAPPTFEEAVKASRHYPSAEEHDLPHCFVCGPARAPGDGLRIFAAPVAGRALVAAPWTPAPALADANGVRPEFLWAALDCPGAFACAADKPMLLGELAVRVDHRPRAGEACIVIGWSVAREGRKHQAGTALFDAARRLCAVGVATWIESKT